MKRIHGTVLLCAFALVAFATPPDSLTKQLQANYNAMGVAFKKNDFAAMSKFFAPNFTAQEPAGPVRTRDQVLGDMKRQMGTIKNVSSVKTVKKVTMDRGDARVTVDGVFKGTMTLQDNKAHNVELKTTNADVWTKVGKVWLLKSIVVLKRDVTIDGKPMKMGG